jgi:NADPH:quinone reductase-like Zn-dependent oxidoreductase
MTESKTMYRAQYAMRGPVPQDVIACESFELPAPGVGEALIAMLAAPINPSDVLTLTGHYGMLPPLPAVGGNEGIGQIVAVGDGIPYPVGTRVLMPLGGGTWSTHVLAPAAALIPLPSEGDVLQLSMLAVNPPTASLLLSEYVDLQPGEWVIQNAANSAVGAYVTQLAHTRGLRVVNVVRRADALQGNTASDVTLVDGADLAERVAAATSGAKIRLALDAVGGSATDRLAQALAVGGTIVNYGALSGEPCKLSPGMLIFRDITLRGFWLVTWMRRATPAQLQALYADLTHRIAQGALSAPVQATYPLAEVKAAVAAAAVGGRQGKIILVP